jgi:hypothetical protein
MGLLKPTPQGVELYLLIREIDDLYPVKYEKISSKM